MIISDVKQGSEEWFALKLGKPSASNFDKIVQMSGQPSKQRDKYMYRLAGERVTGKREDGYSNATMERGIDLEAEARAMYEIVSGNNIKTVGVCYPNEEKDYLCSPDGFVGIVSGVEIKCPLMTTHIAYLLDGDLPSTYYQQVQGSLMVTGLKWWVFISYYPGIKPLIVTVDRDEQFIKALEIELDGFCRELEMLTSKIRG